MKEGRRILAPGIAAVFLALAAMAAPMPGREEAVRVEIKQGGRAEAIDADLARRVAEGFSGAVLVEEDEKVTLKAGYGWANRERGIPFTPRTIAQIGSLTKQFTATAIVDLSVRGKLALSDPIGKFFPVPPVRSAITIEQLLTHTSGLPDACGDDFDRLTRDELVGKCLKKVENPPGKKFSYSNLGYSLLGAVVEKVAGEPLDVLLAKEFFRPLAMTDTGYFFPEAFHDRLAFGYGKNSLAPISDRLAQMDSAFWNLKGNGGMQSTVEDMERWSRALASGSVPSEKVRALLMTPHAHRDDGIAYGYGWFLRTNPAGEVEQVSHTGSDGVFFSAFVWRPRDRVFYYLVTSTGEKMGADLASVILRILKSHSAEKAARASGGAHP